MDERVEEVRALIDELFSPGFVSKTLFKGTQAKIDLKRLIFSGHSMGAATGLKAANLDERISLLML